MFLKSLELQGFKTFPDKTVLRFENGITSVVGPNGSGKSNISDAIRWVLGEQKVRDLRCSKMEDVVFSGTPQRKAQGYAQVTLNIDNRDRGLNFDNDNVAITRRYYRSGESEYLINKAMVRLKDINELFMDTGLGRDGYSMIGQGKIDSIVGAKSEERREIFEEAAGISRFRHRKEDSQRRLRKTQDNLLRLRDILVELEERVEPLRVQAEKAEQFIALDGEKKELEIGIWLETLSKSGKILREYSEKIGTIRTQYEETEQEIESLSVRAEENLRESNFCVARMEAARNEAAQLDEQALRIEGDISVIKNDISHHAQSIERIKGQINITRLSENEINDEIFLKKTEMAERELAIESSGEKLRKYEDRLDSLRQGTDEATKQIEAAAIEMAQIAGEISDEKISISSSESSLEQIKHREHDAQNSINELDKRCDELKKEESELVSMLSELKDNITAKENSVKGHEKLLKSRAERTEISRQGYEKLVLDAKEQSRRARLLEDLERNLEGFGNSVKAVMKESERGNLRGIYGPVTQIIRVSSEYAVALETALGAAMQNIVVENESDAKAAIRLLKQRDSGRATFLPLTNVKGRRIDKNGIDNQIGFVGIASELCQCEEKFHNIRDSLLGRVIITQDLDSAAAIAKKTGYRYRTVSLDGQVVNTGGSLTGGAKARNSGLLSRASEIERIRKRAQTLETRAKREYDEYRVRQAELSYVQAQVEAVKAELTELNSDRIKVEAEHKRTVRDLKIAADEKHRVAAEEKSFGNMINKLENDISISGGKIEELIKKESEVKERLVRITGNRDEQMERCSEISDTISEIRMSELSAQKDRDSLRQAVAELVSRKTDSEGIAKKLNMEIKELEGLSEKLQIQIKQKKETAEHSRALADDKRRQAQEEAIKREELEREGALLRRKERDLSVTRENASGEIGRLNERRDNLQKEYDTIISRLWEDYEMTRREAQEAGISIEDLSKAQRRLAEIKNKIKALGAVNVAAVVEYQEVSQRYNFLKEQIEDVEKSKAELEKIISDLTSQMKEQFIIRFREINSHFIHIFRQLFGGGTAQLSLSDENDVLASGIEIKVHPPGKIVTHTESLSGGEKALVAISIYFAIMKVNPPPFCVLDEIEAALDEMNVSRFAQYLRRMSRSTQFVAITHRRGTMEESDTLYGVTMQDEGISKILAIKTNSEREELKLAT